MSSSLIDLPYGGAVPCEIGSPRPNLPFRKNGDYATLMIERTFLQLAANFYPARLGVDLDARHLTSDDDVVYFPDAYLISESEPSPFGGNPRVSVFSRTYSRIPVPQVTYPGSRWITKPGYDPAAPFNPFDITSGLATSKGSGVYYPTWATKGNTSYSTVNGLYTDGDGAVYTPVQAPSAQAVGYATAGTFTLTYGTSTTAALNYNDPAATINAAVAALADVITAGVTFTLADGSSLAQTSGGTLRFNVTGGSDSARQVPLTMNAAGLTITGTSKNPTTSVTGTSVQQIMLPMHLTIASHGFDTSKALAVVWGSSITFVYPAGYWGSINSNTIWVPNYGYGAISATLAGTYSTTYSISGASTYAGGSRFVRTRVTDTFYLPGISSGITTPADITVPAGLQNPNTFLTALLTPLTGWQVYDSSGPAPWLGGPIYVRSVTEVNFDDLV
jgi:hypothetical protein